MRVDGVVAPNPGLMTGTGTNTWVIESGGRSVVIDPGPIIDSHRSRILALLEGTAPAAVVVTHTHPDHAPAANPLAEELGVPALGASDGPGFAPDRVVRDGDEIRLGKDRLVVVSTPGHTADSTSFRAGDVLFSGDHIIGGSTVVVEDMAAYMGSLERLAGAGIARIYPGHGPVIDEPEAVVSDYLEHRRQREAEILEAVRGGARAVGEIVASVYRDVDSRLHPVATVSVIAHLVKLAREGRVRFDGRDVVSPGGSS